MSILDNHPLAQDPTVLLVGGAAALRAQLAALGDAAPADLVALAQGVPPLAAHGLEARHVDALVQKAVQLLEVGEYERGRALLATALKLDPLNAEAVYAVAASHQLEGDIRTAAHVYLIYVAMRGTDPLGYTRLSECLEAAGEAENAAGARRMAEWAATQPRYDRAEVRAKAGASEQG